MILTLLASFFVLVGLVCILIYTGGDCRNEGWLGTGVVMAVVAGICLLLCIIMFAVGLFFMYKIHQNKSLTN